MFILLLQFLILHIDKLIGKDIPTAIIIELVATNLAYMVVLAAPMAVLVATLMAFGKFSELNELTAVRSAGVNPIQMVVPVLLASVVLFAGLTWFSNSVLPDANQKARSLFLDIRMKKPGFDLKPNSFHDSIDGYTFLVDYVDNKTDSLYGIVLFQEATGLKEQAYIVANSGKMVTEGSNGLTLILKDGVLHKTSSTNTNAKKSFERTRFSEHKITFDIGDLSFEKSDPKKRGRNDRTMNIQSMQVVIDSLKIEVDDQLKLNSQNSFTLPKKSNPEILKRHEYRVLNISKIDSVRHAPVKTDMVVPAAIRTITEQIEVLNRTKNDLENYRATVYSGNNNIIWRMKSINKFIVEIYKKFSIPFSCVIFVLLGAPIGMFTKKGNLGVAAIISTVILTFYWIALIQGEKLADRLYITPFMGMWSFNIIMGIVGIILLLQLSTEFKITKLFGRSDK